VSLASIEYITGRRKYTRPQAMLFANNSGTVVTSGGQQFYVPLGSEINADTEDASGNEFLILSDDNRQPIDIASQRLERRERMINGRMRSYHIADKTAISTSWEMLPSRSFSTNPEFQTSTQGGLAGKPTSAPDFRYTSDGGAGAAELVDWYERYTGSFWVFLAYDKFPAFGIDDAAYQNMNKYNQIVEVMFSDFSHSIVKRGATTHDFWNVSLALEEV
jgi:hypothetical protein